MSFPGKGDMSNQEAYEEICEKAKKYDELKEAVGKIKEELDRKHIHIIANAESQFHDGESYGIEEALVIIDKHTEGLT